MEKEIKTKTIRYGATAVLLSILLGAFAYNFGIQPYIGPTIVQLGTFTSYDEMENFLKTRMDSANTLSSDPRGIGLMPDTWDNSLSTDQRETFGSPPSYSKTNIQVSGVDEADLVKTDGNYLYIVSGSEVYIVGADAYDESTFINKITLEEIYNLEIYINENKLILTGSRYQSPVYKDTPEEIGVYYYVYTEEAIIQVYDLTDKANPSLTRTMTINGTLASSRMIGDYLYATIVQPALRPAAYASIDSTRLPIMLPEITEGDTTKEIPATEIRYVNVTDYSYYFTTVLAVNVRNDAQEITHETILAGTDSKMYVSKENMFLTVTNLNWWLTRANSGDPKEETVIYRVRLEQEKITFAAQGSVPGYVLNQFSMDEYDGYLRVATTVGWGDSATNRMYVLNSSMGIIGELEDLAPGERIYSARFIGNKAYLVTFRQVDPFFVIDLTDPTAPSVLGYLKIPGFSGYLHPYDENHIIGVGKQDNNVKLSLFDVSDVSEPTEAVPPYIVKADWSDTDVLYNHKAFLFDQSKQLLALPVSMSGNLPIVVQEQGVDEKLYYNQVWQGEYVFTVSLSNGFELRGNITHQKPEVDQWYGSYFVKRALYIDDVLYTVSDKIVKMNDLQDLNLLKEVALD